MSVFLVTRNGKKCYQVHFMMKGIRYTKTGFKTKTEARQTELKMREDVKNPKPLTKDSNDMVFAELVIKKLDALEFQATPKHRYDFGNYAKRWIKLWKNIPCINLTEDIMREFIYKRSREVSSHTGNMELKNLNALFRFGVKRSYIKSNPCENIEKLKCEPKKKYISTQEDIDKVIAVADPEM